MPDPGEPGDPADPGDLVTLIATHAALLDRATGATRARTYFTAFAESPSTRIWGDTAPALGKAAFDALLGQPFAVETPGAVGRVAPEQSPYGIELAVTYPHLLADGVDALVETAKRGLPGWRDAGPAARTAIALEIVMRINARSFEFAHAVMHTTGQAFVMAFQAGGAHAHERALEAIAYAHEAMSQVPASVAWEKPRSKGEPQRMTKTFTIVPRGVALVIGCTTFPTWNSYPGLFASLVAGNPVVVKPHPHAVLPLALTVAVARDVLSEYGFDADIVTLAVDDVGEGLASTLATHPDVRIIDFTGSSVYGEWLEQHATQARVFTEKSGVNCVVIDSTDDLDGLAANLAYSLALYSGQMCTTPQTILIPRGGINSNHGHQSADQVVAALGAALDELLADPLRAVNMLGAIVDDTVLTRLNAAATIADVMIASRVVDHPDFPAARVRTPLLVRADVHDESVYAHECFGPVAFIVETENTADSLDRWRRITIERGALTASIYSTDDDVLALAESVALDCGISTSFNLTGDVYVNQTAAFSDYHGTGANKAANASLTDLAFVADRFRIVESRRPQ
jgi:phenylacetic acid degradation protein paaN